MVINYGTLTHNYYESKISEHLCDQKSLSIGYYLYIFFIFLYKNKKIKKLVVFFYTSVILMSHYYTKQKNINSLLAKHSKVTLSLKTISPRQPLLDKIR